MKSMDHYQAITIAEITFPLLCFGFNQHRANIYYFTTESLSKVKLYY
jgi:hypothetical protein